MNKLSDRIAADIEQRAGQRQIIRRLGSRAVLQELAAGWLRWRRVRVSM